MAFIYQYPSDIYKTDLPYVLTFYGRSYSLDKNSRTRSSIRSNPEIKITLPMPKEPGYLVAHEFGESNNNPVGPMLTRAGIANAGGGVAGAINVLKRTLQPSTFYWERMFATSTYRRFSNIAEATMVSEARKKYFFQYIFVPKNKDESEEVENIIGSFRKGSYPILASNLPERSYPQGLWTFQMAKNKLPAEAAAGQSVESITANWLGEPLVCVLETVKVERNDASDPVIRVLPNGYPSITLLGLVFTEFETGTYVPGAVNEVRSKSEIAAGTS